MRTFNSKEANTGVILHDLYKAIWPEGPKTIGSDVARAADIATNPDKRQHAKDSLESLKTLPGLAGLYAKEKIQHAKNRLKGLTPENLDPETGMPVLIAKQKNMLEDLSNEL